MTNKYKAVMSWKKISCHATGGEDFGQHIFDLVAFLSWFCENYKYQIRKAYTRYWANLCTNQIIFKKKKKSRVFYSIIWELSHKISV